MATGKNTHTDIATSSTEGEKRVNLLRGPYKKCHYRLFRAITPTFLGGFLHFFYHWKEKWMPHRRVTKFALTVSPHYLIQTKKHKTAHFEVKNPSVPVMT